jgi:ankyrin repeat protein
MYYKIPNTLQMACKEGCPSFIKHMKESGITKNDIEKEARQEAALQAAANGHVEVLKSLHLYLKFDINYEGKPLIEACKNGHLDIVKYIYDSFNISREILLEKDVYFRALKHACKNGHLEIVKYLYTTDVGMTLNDKLVVIKYMKNDKFKGYQRQSEILEYLINQNERV